MLFTSPVFIYLFLPVLLLLYLATPRALKNILLLLASLLFYAWGEIQFFWIFLLSMACNYCFGLAIDRTRNWTYGSTVLMLTCAANIALLACFKYVNFISNNLVSVLAAAGITVRALSPVHLPIGISFFTFHAISYLIDVSRGTSRAQRNPWNLALYLALFPQLIAGPIIRYHDIADQIVSRDTRLDNFYFGLRRFVFGLAKKLIIANPLGLVADEIFSIPGQELTAPLAWLGSFSYTLQLYFDFSAYSCMAIGLARVFGFHFLENFNYPYIAESIQDFWRRWHISLSRWFRDYLYIPLGGNRLGTRRTYVNLCLVFFLCGLWHGASWNFVAWGLFHGLFLALERAGLGTVVRNLWRPLRHVYTLLLVMLAWVFFRADTLPHAMQFLTAMAGFGATTNVHHDAHFYFNNEFILVCLFAVAFSTPVWHSIEARLEGAAATGDGRDSRRMTALTLASTAWITMLAFACVLYINAGTYNPFIYFRF
jgi:alginate O-acetyltransferase complex protein AlgI